MMILMMMVRMMLIRPWVDDAPMKSSDDRKQVAHDPSDHHLVLAAKRVVRFWSPAFAIILYKNSVSST